MEGVVSWADRIQAIRSQRPILQSTKFRGQPETNFCQIKFQQMENQCLQNEGVDWAIRLYESIVGSTNIHPQTMTVGLQSIDCLDKATITITTATKQNRLARN